MNYANFTACCQIWVPDVQTHICKFAMRMQKMQNTKLFSCSAVNWSDVSVADSPTSTGFKILTCSQKKSRQYKLGTYVLLACYRLVEPVMKNDIKIIQSHYMMLGRLFEFILVFFFRKKEPLKKKTKLT